jgi:hypothetical protein
MTILRSGPFAGRHRGQRFTATRRYARRAAVTFAGSFILGAALAVMTPGAHAATVATPAQEWAACTAAYSLHSHREQHVPIPPSAVAYTIREASHADPALRGYIVHYAGHGTQWALVAGACDPDSPAGQQ